MGTLSCHLGGSKVEWPHFRPLGESPLAPWQRQVQPFSPPHHPAGHLADPRGRDRPAGQLRLAHEPLHRAAAQGAGPAAGPRHPAEGVLHAAAHPGPGQVSAARGPPLGLSARAWGPCAPFPTGTLTVQSSHSCSPDCGHQGCPRSWENKPGQSWVSQGSTSNSRPGTRRARASEATREPSAGKGRGHAGPRDTRHSCHVQGAWGTHERRSHKSGLAVGPRAASSCPHACAASPPPRLIQLPCARRWAGASVGPGAHRFVGEKPEPRCSLSGPRPLRAQGSSWRADLGRWAPEGRAGFPGQEGLGPRPAVLCDTLPPSLPPVCLQEVSSRCRPPGPGAAGLHPHGEGAGGLAERARGGTAAPSFPPGVPGPCSLLVPSRLRLRMAPPAAPGGS